MYSYQALHTLNIGTSKLCEIDQELCASNQWWEYFSLQRVQIEVFDSVEIGEK